MSYADKLFRKMCTEIIENGTDTRGEDVRPVWEDTGEKAYTIKQFGIVNRYDLRKEFPALTFRKTGIKSAMDEILWIFQRKSNNIHDLKPHIWDEWADENGLIGKAYGYQIGEKYIHHSFTLNDFPSIDAYETYSAQMKREYPSYEEVWTEGNEKVQVKLDQIDAVIYDLKHTPFNRRIMTSIWNFDELHEMNLQPCCWSCMFSVTDEGSGNLVLNMTLTQRSNDVLAANNWNVVQYALLLMMIAQVCGMEAGILLHVINDAHIYDRHVDIVKELIQRESYPAPIVKLNPNVTDFYKFTTDDLTIENYIAGEQVKNIPIAV